MTEETKQQAYAVTEECIELLANNKISKDTAKAAVKGTVKEIIEICEKEAKEKNDRVNALRSALELADKQIRELQKNVPAQEKQEPKKRAFKEKICKQCGKTFVPHYGAQTLCNDCKTSGKKAQRIMGTSQKKTNQKAAVDDDITKTAKELAEMS